MTSFVFFFRIALLAASFFLLVALRFLKASYGLALSSSDHSSLTPAFLLPLSRAEGRERVVSPSSESVSLEEARPTTPMAC